MFSSIEKVKTCYKCNQYIGEADMRSKKDNKQEIFYRFSYKTFFFEIFLDELLCNCSEVSVSE